MPKFALNPLLPQKEVAKPELTKCSPCLFHCCFKCFHSFSDVGDSVLVSAGHKDTYLTRAALNEGRVAIVLEPTASKLTATGASLDLLAGIAAKEGMWARMLKVSKPLVTVGPRKLPVLVPASNIPAARATEVQALRVQGSEDPERQLAYRSAGMHGLQIKVRTPFDTINFIF